MKRSWLLIQLAAVAAVYLMAAIPSGHCLITGGEGNDPMEHDPGFPTGALEVANLKSRLGFYQGPPFGGGEYHFSYQCNSAKEFNDALALFSKIQVPNTISYFSSFVGDIRIQSKNEPLLLVIHDAPKISNGLDFGGKRVDWAFTVWAAESFHRVLSGGDSFMADHPGYRQPVPPPRIDAYVGGDSPIVWDEVKVPQNIQTIDWRRAARPDEEASFTIRGRVFDMTSQKLIPGAMVSIVKHDQKEEPSPAEQTKTDEQGRYSIRTSQDGYFYLVVNAEGYVPRRVFGFTGKDYKAEWDVTLLKGTSLNGTVTDTEGKPLPGIKVKAWEMIGIDGLGYESATETVAVTDAEGRFEFANLPHGTVRLDCLVEGMHQKNSILERFKVTPYPFEKQENITLVLEGTGTVKGRITDENGNPPGRESIVEINPEQGPVVGSWGGSKTLNPDGTYEFTNVPPGTYILKAMPNPRSDNEESKPHTVTVKAGETTEVNITTEHVKAK